MTDDARVQQAAYYEQTAAEYEAAHVAPGDGNYVSLEYISGLCDTVRAGNLLDVGAGTGRAVAFLRDRRPGLDVVGVEPVAALRAQAEARGIGGVLDGDGTALPFDDDSFDVVIATAVMHHLEDPSVVIAEMCRVARKAVMISDANRFGQSSLPSNLVKLGLKATRLWAPYMSARTRGKGHLYSEGDGVYYSYSVYDSAPQVAAWADRTFVIPVLGQRPPRRYTGPLLTSQAGLLVGVKEPCFDGWAGTAPS